MSRYDHPNFSIIRQDHRLRPDAASGFSVPSANTVYIGSTFRCYTKAVVLGVTFIIGSGASGSLSATNSFSVVLMDTEGTVLSARNVTTVLISQPGSAIGDVIDISLTDALTLASVGQAAGLRANAASLDKIPILSDIIWRYRIMDYDIPAGNIG